VFRRSNDSGFRHFEKSKLHPNAWTLFRTVRFIVWKTFKSIPIVFHDGNLVHVVSTSQKIDGCESCRARPAPKWWANIIIVFIFGKQTSRDSALGATGPDTLSTTDGRRVSRLISFAPKPPPGPSFGAPEFSRTNSNQEFRGNRWKEGVRHASRHARSPGTYNKILTTNLPAVFARNDAGTEQAFGYVHSLSSREAFGRSRIEFLSRREFPAGRDKNLIIYATPSAVFSECRSTSPVSLTACLNSYYSPHVACLMAN